MLGLSLGVALLCVLPLGLWVPSVRLSSWLLLLLSFQLLSMYLLWTFWMAHPGYLHLPKASLRCCISFWKSSGLQQTVLALWVRVSMTLYLAERLWWLSQCMYWSVWVGMWYTVIDKKFSKMSPNIYSSAVYVPPDSISLIQFYYEVNHRTQNMWFNNTTEMNLYRSSMPLQICIIAGMINIFCSMTLLLRGVLIFLE